MSPVLSTPSILRQLYKLLFKLHSALVLGREKYNRNWTGVWKERAARLWFAGHIRHQTKTSWRQLLTKSKLCHANRESLHPVVTGKSTYMNLIKPSVWCHINRKCYRHYINRTWLRSTSESPRQSWLPGTKTSGSPCWATTQHWRSSRQWTNVWMVRKWEVKAQSHSHTIPL